MPDVTAAGPYVLILGTADWDQPIATNQHHVAAELHREFRVSFVESMGLRRPEMTMRDLRRAAGRVTTSLTRGRAPGQRRIAVDVLSPLMIPDHSGPFRQFNQHALRRATRSWRRHTGTRVLWTYSPVTYGLELFAHRTFYHCVDLLGEVAGISKWVIETNETALARQGVIAIGTGDVVVDHLRDQGFDPLQWPNVAEVEVIEAAARSVGPRVPGRLVFAGNLNARKVDFRILGALVQAGFELDLAGPVAEGGGSSTSQVQALVASGAVYHGMLGLRDLARLYAAASVGLIPYLLNSYTMGVDPMKTFEYLAAGLTVVSTDIPAVAAMAGRDIVVAADRPSFLRSVRAVDPVPSEGDLSRRRATARRHSWTDRGEAARELVRHAMPSSPPIVSGRDQDQW